MKKIIKKGYLVEYNFDFHDFVHYEIASKDYSIKEFEEEFGGCHVIRVSIINSLDSVYDINILDDVEKEYLSNVIKPFRSRNPKIVKFSYDNDKEEFIVIDLDNRNTIEELLLCDGVYICFPLFKKGSMYKGMESDKEYTLEDLGL